MEFTGKTDEIVTWDVPAGRSISWLEEVLRRTVLGVHTEPLTHSVTLGTLKLMTVTFQHGDKRAKTTLVLKQESSSLSTNTFAAKAKCFLTEHTFYVQLARKCSAKVPKCLYSSISPDKTAATLLLEHIFSALPGDETRSLTLQQLKAAAVELGRLHGSFYNDETSCSAVKTVSEHLAESDHIGSLDDFLSVWSDVLEPFKDENDCNAVVKVFEHCAAHKLNWKSLLDTGVKSIVHGDFKSTNVMFPEEEEHNATILDFQALYSGICTTT